MFIVEQYILLPMAPTSIKLHQYVRPLFIVDHPPRIASRICAKKWRWKHSRTGTCDPSDPTETIRIRRLSRLSVTVVSVTASPPPFPLTLSSDCVILLRCQWTQTNHVAKQIHVNLETLQRL